MTAETTLVNTEKSKPSSTVDVVLPLYRPHQGWEERVSEAARTLHEHFDSKNIELHLYIVNDGADLSYFPPCVLKYIEEKSGCRFTFLSYERNRGKGYALRYAINKCQGEIQIYTDGDFPFGAQSVIDAHSRIADGADIAMGVRPTAYSDALCGIRRGLSKGAKWLVINILGLPKFCSDTQAGIKGFNGSGRDAFLSTRVESFLFDTEFITIANCRSLKIATVNLTLREGLVFSKMGTKVIVRELKCFAGILIRYRWRLIGRKGAVHFNEQTAK